MWRWLWMEMTKEAIRMVWPVDDLSFTLLWIISHEKIYILEERSSSRSLFVQSPIFISIFFVTVENNRKWSYGHIKSISIPNKKISKASGYFFFVRFIFLFFFCCFSFFGRRFLFFFFSSVFCSLVFPVGILFYPFCSFYTLFSSFSFLLPFFSGFFNPLFLRRFFFSHAVKVLTEGGSGLNRDWKERDI